jgi:LmbE family N-acetylglucosaminyl deacetylase
MRVLVFCAHPDDAEFALGGTLLRLAEHHSLTLVVVTDGGAGSHGDPVTRQREQDAAARFLGAQLVWLGEPDCSLEYTRERVMRLAALIREHRPDLILVPHPDQTGGIHDGLAHPDHRHLGLAMRDAARFARFRIPVDGERHETKHLWYYMVPRDRVPKLLVPIDAVEHKLVELWKSHASQTRLRDGKIIEHLLAHRHVCAGDLKDCSLAEAIDSDTPIPVDLVTVLFRP